ncbi:MAG: TIR domain-containing protein [Anaerolineales bacterium]|nr:TIR domain-containing protein [Anaerolineales bacterium]
MEGGTRWSKEIEKAIKGSQYVVVVLSPDSVESTWVEEEILFARNLRKKIVPLLFRPCEIPLGFHTLNFINVQNNKYQQNYKEILRALGINYLEREAAEQARLKAEEEEQQRIAKEKADRQASEKAAREKAEKEAAEKAEEKERQRIAKEKADREAAEKKAAEQARLKAKEEEQKRIAKEKADRQAAERADREKAEKEAAEKARLKAEKATQDRIDRKIKRQKLLKKTIFGISNIMPGLRLRTQANLRLLITVGITSLIVIVSLLLRSNKSLLLNQAPTSSIVLTQLHLNAEGTLTSMPLSTLTSTATVVFTPTDVVTLTEIVTQYPTITLTPLLPPTSTPTSPPFSLQRDGLGGSEYSLFVLNPPCGMGCQIRWLVWKGAWIDGKQPLGADPNSFDFDGGPDYDSGWKIVSSSSMIFNLDTRCASCAQASPYIVKVEVCTDQTRSDCENLSTMLP